MNDPNISRFMPSPAQELDFDKKADLFKEFDEATRELQKVRPTLPSVCNLQDATLQNVSKSLILAGSQCTNCT